MDYAVICNFTYKTIERCNLRENVRSDNIGPRPQNNIFCFVSVIGRFRLLSQELFEEYLAAQGT